MTSKNRQNSVTAGKLKDVMERDQANLRAAMPKPAGAPKLGPGRRSSIRIREPVTILTTYFRSSNSGRAGLIQSALIS